ncbi:MAG: hypothetical protein WBV82_01040 [Myxococcaceae bacterium]
MRRILLAALLALGGCSSDPGTEDGGETRDGGGNDAGTQERWTIQTLIGEGELVDFDMALAADGRVGIAYYARIEGHTFGSEPDYELRYVEWNAGQVGQPEVLRKSQRVNGVDIAFQADGQPMIAYIGGDTPLATSQFWHQSDAAIARRSAGGTWTEEIVAERGDEAMAGNPVSDRGFLVGLFPALATDGTNTYFAWRDCHDGQFPQQAWNGSDLEVAAGRQGSWDKRVVIAGGDDKQAWGGHIQMVMANGQPAIISDQVFGGADGSGSNVAFNRRNADGTWTPTARPIKAIANTQSGPSLDWDPTLGFAVAVVERADSKLLFTRTIDDGKTWTEPHPVFQSGSGGWYPSLSINPVTHEPTIAFYVCSRSAGSNEGNCVPGDDRLMVSERISNIWREETVDVEGAWKPKLEHLADGRRVIVYRDPRSGAIKLAVEK